MLISFPSNQEEGYGFLRVMSLQERPNPRDIVIFETLPNELSRVAGIITTVPQTPLAHVNLRAVQDGVPNSFIRDALDDSDIADLIGSFVHYAVTNDGYSISAATRAEVDAHHAASRPAQTQTPEGDLTVTEITDLDDIDFDDWDAFGVKATNLAVLRTLGFPDRTVPDGFAVPFYFYDEFMKHNGFYDDIEEMLADPEFQSDYGMQEDELKKLRKKIKKGKLTRLDDRGHWRKCTPAIPKGSRCATGPAPTTRTFPVSAVRASTTPRRRSRTKRKRTGSTSH